MKFIQPVPYDPTFLESYMNMESCAVPETYASSLEIIHSRNTSFHDDTPNLLTEMQQRYLTSETEIGSLMVK